ncbi:SymE family type I addiction module toxin [Paraburkholderia rhizosphaerae]|nr:SymE family type I addiction module toxin [Paraburkholderia rhizosphaerae]
MYPDAPWIRLAGRWLEKAGFPISGRVRVEVKQGKLTITPA